MTTLLPLFTALFLLPGAATHAQVVDEVPFITTPDHVTVAMLELAGVTKDDHVIDLGSGDGRIVITAARRFGASGLGVEIVPELVQRSRVNAERAGVASRARFLEQDLFKTDLAPASVITMYLLPDVNLLLRPALLKLKPGTRIVSHDWDMGDWAPDQTITVDVPDKAVGLEKLSRLHRWVVPAAVQGRWCGPGGSSLRIEQRYQWVEGVLEHAKSRWPLKGRLDGSALALWGAAGMGLQLQAGGDVMRVVSNAGGGPGRAGTDYRRSAAAVCPANG
jgi:SAM-dependent methyltransferase